MDDFFGALFFFLSFFGFGRSQQNVWKRNENYSRYEEEGGTKSDATNKYFAVIASLRFAKRLMQDGYVATWQIESLTNLQHTC